MADDMVLGAPIRRRLKPVIFILDCSGPPDSEKIRTINRGMRGTLAAMRRAAEDNPRTAIMIGIIAYASVASWHRPYPTLIERCEWSDLASKGGSPNLAGAVDLAARALLDVPPPFYYVPVLCLISDSASGSVAALEKSMDALVSSGIGSRADRCAIGFEHNVDDRELQDVVRTFVCHPAGTVMKARTAEDLEGLIGEIPGFDQILPRWEIPAPGPGPRKSRAAGSTRLVLQISVPPVRSSEPPPW